MRAALAAVLALLAGPAIAEQQAAGGACVTLGKPGADDRFHYRRSDANAALRYSLQWHEYTDRTARFSVRGSAGNEDVVNSHRVVDDVTMIESTTSSGPKGSHRTTFSPRAMGEPLFRVCAGRSWRIPPVSVTNDAGGRRHTAPMPGGKMEVVSLRETITVPAGTFECVHYRRTLDVQGGPSVDDYWRSIRHGVVVRQVSRLPKWTSTMELQSID